MAANLHVSSETYTPGKRNATLSSGTGVKWVININQILNIKLPAKGSELPVYHLRHIGERKLLTKYVRRRHLTDDWKHKHELLNIKRRQLTAIGKT